MICNSKDLFKNFSCLFTNINHEVLIFEVDGVVKNIEKQISQKQGIIFPWKEKN